MIFPLPATTENSFPFCKSAARLRDQMVEEFKNCLALAKHCLQTLGVEEDVTYRLSKWDPDNSEKYIGSAEVWEETQQHIRDVLTELDIKFVEGVGEAAFYGPKVDIQAKNVYGKCIP